MKTLHDRTKTLSLALIAMTASFAAAPAAFAQDKHEVRVAFSYNTSDTAQQIYADLERTAREACEFNGYKSLQMRKVEQACANGMIDQGVAKLQRADVAALHNGGFTKVAAGSRG